MIIVAISHGFNCDSPFTQTYQLDTREMPVTSLTNLFGFLDKQSNIESSHIDELMVILDDTVRIHYTSKEIDELFDKVEDEELEEYDAVA